MPIFMDRHQVQDVTASQVAAAHAQDLQYQDQYGVRFMTYWFDEARGTTFCLADAPDKDAVQQVHRVAHGLLPNEIIEVDASLVEMFLGRVKDPAATTAAEPGVVDAAFRAIMFTDLKDSTAMATRLGDTEAMRLLRLHNAMITSALSDHDGHQVKHTGDGIMASFASILAAVECAITIQKSFARYNSDDPETPMLLRIGLSAGEPVEEHGDLFGTAVNLAARLCALAEPGSILVAQVVWDQCQGAPLTFSESIEVSPKGFDQPIRVYEVMWCDG